MTSGTRPDGTGVAFCWGQRIPLRDGTALNATLYTPEAPIAPTPCIVTMTPYTSDSYHDRGMYFAMAGFAFLIVDVRGRGNSEGIFRPSLQEAEDGYDVVEWTAGQPWCDGQVAMWGGSYAGYAQWAAARTFPPHLATIAPAAAPYRGIGSPMRNNIFFPERTQWITLVSGRTHQGRIYADGPFWSTLYRRWFESGESFRNLDLQTGNPSPLFQEWLSHPEPNDYWDAHNPTAEQYAKLSIPVLTITGAYDGDQPGALEHYKTHMRFASEAARARHYLIIGPWDHAGTRTPAAEFGGLRVGVESLIDLPQLHVEWYRWTMQQGTRPAFLRGKVAYYVMGAEQWRYAASIDAITSREMVLHLDSHGSATDVFASGSLGESAGSGQPDSYTYDPRVVSGIEVEAEASTPSDAIVDQRLTMALRGHQLVYHSAPFEEALDVCGFFKLRAWIALDCPDTDLYVTVYEITLAGNCIRLSTDAIRARYREGLRTPKLIVVRDPLLYEFTNATFVARRILRGHRLRLVIAPMGRLSATNFMQKNYNAGGVVAEESAIDGRPVTVTLFHDALRPSALHVPIGRDDT